MSLPKQIREIRERSVSRDGLFFEQDRKDLFDHIADLESEIDGLKNRNTQLEFSNSMMVSAAIKWVKELKQKGVLT